MHERRSTAGAQMPLGLECRPGDLEDISQGGVGARRARRGPRRRGGGYLNERTSREPWEEAKIRELEVMGLPVVWLEVARTIGYDQFLTMWQLLDRSLQLRSESESMIEVKLRRWSSFQRFQRNRFIEHLVRAGFDDRAIQDMVRGQLGEKLSLSHIFRLADRRARRVRAA